MSAHKEKHPRRPWRENIEAFTVAIVMAVMLKYFAIEAYKIPTGSMQPTLMGLGARDLRAEYRESSINDRILVDKLSFHFRDPRRWEVVIFKYPLNRAQNFVKRLVGMPGEELRIQYGDLWTRTDASEAWKVLRRPSSVMAAHWKPLDVGEPASGERWRIEGPAGGRAAFDGRDAEIEGEVALRFVAHGAGAITDEYTDGYPIGVRRALNPRGGTNHVGDLRWSGRVRARADLARFALEISEGGRRYTFDLPGPAAPSDASPRIDVAWAPRDGESSEPAVGAAFRLPPERFVRVEASNLDDRLALEVDGRVLVEREVPPNPGPGSGVAMRAHGGASLRDVQVCRDIYYTPGTWGPEWKIDAGHYFMLGDNTQDSSDSREWPWVTLAWKDMPEGRDTVRGNSRRQASPRAYELDANPVRDDGTTYLRDEWGELYVFPTQDEIPLSSPAIAPGPLVPRHLIAGRALAVFWPAYSFAFETTRLRWIR